MNRQELGRILEQEGVSKDAYSLMEDRTGDRYILLQQKPGTWAVYYSERGEQNDLEIFNTEHEACCELLRRLLSDPTTRKR